MRGNFNQPLDHLPLSLEAIYLASNVFDQFTDNLPDALKLVCSVCYSSRRSRQKIMGRRNFGIEPILFCMCFGVWPFELTSPSRKTDSLLL